LPLRLSLRLYNNNLRRLLNMDLLGRRHNLRLLNLSLWRNNGHGLLGLHVSLMRNRFYYNRRGARDNHAQMFRGRLRYVDYPPFDKRPPVVHPDRDLPVVVPVGYDQKRSERQSGMGRGEKAWVKNLPRSGRPALELGAIPRGDTLLPENCIPNRSRRLSRHILWKKQAGNTKCKYGNTYTSHTSYYRHLWGRNSQGGDVCFGFFWASYALR